MTLKVSISGVRGITGESLTDEVVADFSMAFAAYLGRGKSIILGRDSRSSGEKIKDIVISNLNTSGINVTYIGIVPTPTVQVMVKHLGADGGMIVTASHNPGQWNGLKFVRGDGIFLNEKEAGRLIDIYEKKKFLPSPQKGRSSSIADAYGPHINKVLGCIDINAIRSRKFKVVLDSCNGAGSLISQELLKALGCEVTPLHCDVSKPFPHDPEPVPKNLSELCNKVIQTGADIGFAQDADADRLAIVTNKGIAPGEEYTLAIAVQHVLAKSSKGATVVTNLSTSMMVDDISRKFGAKVTRTKIGEVNVAEKMLRLKALIGGEGNGGVMHPMVGYNRDSLVGIALVLAEMAGSGKTISQIIDGLPHYVIVKQKVECGSRDEADRLINKIRSVFKGGKLDTADGVKVIYHDSWVHVRSSNTEPVVRIISEAKSAQEALSLIEKVKHS